MSKILAILMALAMLFGLAACGKEDIKDTSKNKKSTISSSTAPNTTETPTGTVKRLAAANLSVTGSESGTAHLDYVYDHDGLERIDFYLEGKWRRTELFCGSIACPEGSGALGEDGEMYKYIDHYYDENGNLIQFDNDGVYYYRRYDHEGNLQVETQYIHHGGLTIEHTLYTYDDGLLTKTETYSIPIYFDDDGSGEYSDFTPSVWSSSDTYTYEFHESGEIKKKIVTSDSGSVDAVYEYDERGNLLRSEDRRGTPTYFRDYQYDEQGNLIREERGYGNSGYIVNYQYDDDNRLIEERTDSHVTTYYYNEDGDVEKAIIVHENDNHPYTVTATFEYETVSDSVANEESLDKYIEYAIECF